MPVKIFFYFSLNKVIIIGSMLKTYQHYALHTNTKIIIEKLFCSVLLGINGLYLKSVVYRILSVLSHRKREQIQVQMIYFN